MHLRYVTGDATTPIGDGRKIIAHVTNNSGGWGAPKGRAGFVQAISRKWSAPEKTFRAHKQVLGFCEYVPVERDLWVANMCAQAGYATRDRPVAIDYEALGMCLDSLAWCAIDLGASVHCPRIGCGLGGGRWETVEALLTQRLVANGVPVTVYDL